MKLSEAQKLALRKARNGYLVDMEEDILTLRALERRGLLKKSDNNRGLIRLRDGKRFDCEVWYITREGYGWAAKDYQERAERGELS